MILPVNLSGTLKLQIYDADNRLTLTPRFAAFNFKHPLNIHAFPQGPARCRLRSSSGLCYSSERRRNAVSMPAAPVSSLNAAQNKNNACSQKGNVQASSDAVMKMVSYTACGGGWGLFPASRDVAQRRRRSFIYQCLPNFSFQSERAEGKLYNSFLLLHCNLSDLELVWIAVYDWPSQQVLTHPSHLA